MTLQEQLSIYFKGNYSAVLFVTELLGLWHTWDDLIDQDKPLTDEQINSAFIGALVKLPRNDFYQANFWLINPIVSNAITNWITSTSLERDDSEYALDTLDIAYKLRNSYLDIISTCAEIIGGREWASAVIVDSQKASSIRKPFADYKADLDIEKGLRG